MLIFLSYPFNYHATPLLWDLLGGPKSPGIEVVIFSRQQVNGAAYICCVKHQRLYMLEKNNNIF